MEKKQHLEMIKRISDAPGVSGFEDLVLDEVRTYVDGMGTVSRDHLNNLYLERNGNQGGRLKIMLDAHTDEVGFMIKAVRPDGMLEFINLGGWITSNIPAHLVLVRNTEGEYVKGVVASKPPHFMTEAEKKAPLEVSSLIIDIGTTCAEEVLNDYKIVPGCPVVPDVDFIYDEKHDIMRGKAFDNRLGCCSIIDTFRLLKDEVLDKDLVGAFASQEEVGTRGATLTGNHVKPDLCICFEGCPADDTVVPQYQVQTALKKGPMLRYIDARMITNPRFQKYALDMAKKHGIPTQASVRASGATDGAPIHLSNMGVPCIVIGIPVRYAHTHYGYSTYEDYMNGIKLAVEIIKAIDMETVRSF